MEDLLSFVLTYCDSDCIQEVMLQKMNIEKARTRLEFDNIDLDENDEIDDDDDDESHKFTLTNLRRFFFSTDKPIEDNELFESKYESTRVLLEKLIDLRVNSSGHKHAVFVKLFNELAKTDASTLFAYLLELDEAQLGKLFPNIDDEDRINSAIQFDSFVSYEFLLYLFALNLINESTSDRDTKFDAFKPSTLNEYILSRQN